jgi:hypothetical protein
LKKAVVVVVAVRLGVLLLLVLLVELLLLVVLLIELLVREVVVVDSQVKMMFCRVLTSWLTNTEVIRGQPKALALLYPLDWNM